MAYALLLLPAGGFAFAGSPITLATFDGSSSTSRRWSHMDDPVMGGQSKSTFEVKTGAGVFNGTCAIVPFLKAPGFCKIQTAGLFQSYADASQFISGSLYLSVRSTTPAFQGFKVAFDAKNISWPHKGFHHGSPSYKAPFAVPSGAAFSTVKVPFNTFSSDWSEYTGRCGETDPTGVHHVCCSAEHPDVCPQAQHLSQLTGLEVWAEGSAGDFHLEIASIAAGP